MMRSFFTLIPGLQSPAAGSIQVMGSPELVVLGDLWEVARKAPRSLLFRVRTSQGADARSLAEGDRLESCVGVVDAATRWRAVFRMSGPALAAIPQPALRQACTQALAFVSSTHPAAVTPEQRGGAIGAIAHCIEAPAEGQPEVTKLAQEIARGIARIVAADNDIEAAHYVPFVEALNDYPEAEREEHAARLASIHTVAGAILLAEAANRLAEVAPMWIGARCPAWEPVADAAQARRRSDD